MIRIYMIDYDMDEHKGLWHINHGCLVCEHDKGELTQTIYPLSQIELIEEIRDKGE